MNIFRIRRIIWDCMWASSILPYVQFCQTLVSSTDLNQLLNVYKAKKLLQNLPHLLCQAFCCTEYSGDH